MSLNLKQRRRQAPGSTPNIAVEDVLEVASGESKQASRKRSIAKTVVLAVLACVVLYALIRLYYRLEKWITNPAWECMLFKPISYFEVKFRQPPSSSSNRKFRMTYNNTFVVHLESDTQRLKQFQRQDLQFQLFDATKLTKESGSLRANLNKTNNSLDYWIHTYRSVRYRISIGKLGDAAVAISHLRLLQRFVNEQHDDHAYMFVFEDDARLTREFLQSKAVMASADADFVFLMKSALKTVPLSQHHTQNGVPTRVLSGWGTYGYVVTTRGARIMLQQLQSNQYDPIDVAIMKLGVKHLRIYLPLSHWPQVHHGAVLSSKRQYNIG